MELWKLGQDLDGRENSAARMQDLQRVLADAGVAVHRSAASLAQTWSAWKSHQEKKTLFDLITKADV